MEESDIRDIGHGADRQPVVYVTKYRIENISIVNGPPKADGSFSRRLRIWDSKNGVSDIVAERAR
jgi:hypothetical protein